MCENKTDMPAPSAEQLCDLAELFKVFGDSTRIRILCALIGGELCRRDRRNARNDLVRRVSSVGYTAPK